MGGGQVGAVIAEGRIPVVTAVGLDQYAHMPQLQAPDREAGYSSGGANQSHIEFRRSPHRLQPLAALAGEAGIPVLVCGKGQQGQGGSVLAFRIVAASSQQHLDQGLAIDRHWALQLVASPRKPLQHQGR